MFTTILRYKVKKSSRGKAGRARVRGGGGGSSSVCVGWGGVGGGGEMTRGLAK